MRSLQQLIEIPTQPIQGRGSHYLQLPTELYNSAEALDLTSTQRVQFYLKRHRRTVIVPDVYNVADHHGVNVHVAVLHVPTSSTIENVLIPTCDELLFKTYGLSLVTIFISNEFKPV